MTRIREFYLRHEVRFLWLGLLAVVVAIAYDDAHDEDVDRRRTCQSAVEARAAQLIDAELLIIASAREGDETDRDRQERVDRFREIERETWLGDLPPICGGVYTIAEFVDEVDAHVAEKLDSRDLARDVAWLTLMLR